MSRLFSKVFPSFVALSAISVPAVLTGCGAATSFNNPTTSVGFKGRVFGGQQPVSGSTVTIWAAGVTGYGSANTLGALSTTTTQADGSFDFTDATSYVCAPGEQVYITASGGTSVPGDTNPSNPLNPNPNANIMLATGLGDCAASQTDSVEINEVTTAVTAFALAQFFTPTLGTSSTDSFGTDPADLTAFTNSNEYTIPTLVDISTGMVKPNTPAITIESAKIYSIANTIAACVNDDTDGYTNCASLYANTTPPTMNPVAPTDTLQAAVQMALYPYQNVEPLYTLASKTPPFTGLPTLPNDWTVGVSYTSSNYALSMASVNFPAGSTSATSASIDIDASGKIWFASNLPGSTGIAYFDPTSTAFNGPYLTGDFTQPQYVAIDTNGLIWTTDLATAELGNTDTTDPGGLNYDVGQIGIGATLGPIAADNSGDVFFFNDPTSSNTYLSGYVSGTGLEELGLLYTPISGLVADSGVIANTGVAWASFGETGIACGLEDASTASATSATFVAVTGNFGCAGGGVAFATSGQDVISTASTFNQFCFEDAQACGGPPTGFTADVNLPEGIATDGYGNEWIANSGNASLFTFGGVNTGYTYSSPVAYLHDTDHGGTMTTPYAIAIDGSGNVWVANAGCVTSSTATATCTPGNFVLSELIGAAGPTITPLSAQMVSGGYLVGQLPGTIVPISESSAHPHSSASPLANGQPLVWRR
jgi:hypothetical protein